MNGQPPEPLHTLSRRGAGADDKFGEFKWFTIGTVLALFGISFLGFAITELWAADIKKTLDNRKLFKSLKSLGDDNTELEKQTNVLVNKHKVDRDMAKQAFKQNGKEEYEQAIKKVRG